MRAVVQRVSQAGVTVDKQVVAQIGKGLLILLGIAPQDTHEQADYLARKIYEMRIFEDQEGKLNRSLMEVEGQVIVVSQFTLYADTRKGRRPSFTDAAPPDIASPLVDYFAECFRAQGIDTQQGIFGADMLVDISNDGPVTILLER